MEKSQLDSECSELRRQIRDLKEIAVKDTQTRENDRTSLCRQLELVCSLLPAAFFVHLLNYLLSSKQLTSAYLPVNCQLMFKCMQHADVMLNIVNIIFHSCDSH